MTKLQEDALEIAQAAISAAGASKFGLCVEKEERVLAKTVEGMLREVLFAAMKEIERREKQVKEDEKKNAAYKEQMKKNTGALAAVRKTKAQYQMKIEGLQKERAELRAELEMYRKAERQRLAEGMVHEDVRA
jgi:predicted RNase H-like nuclease (RuvC/YqgF family)